jgi:hypothetical protein
MRKATPRERLGKMVDAIDRGHFELIECEAVAVTSEPRQYTVTVILERLVAPGAPNKKPLRQSKVRELIFDED